MMVIRMTMMIMMVAVVVLINDTCKIIKRMVYDPYQHQCYCSKFYCVSHMSIGSHSRSHIHWSWI